MRLPLPLGQPTPAHAQPTEIVLPPLRILAVDDVPANLELLQIALAQGGHRVVLAGTGQEALDRCARQRFDLVLMTCRCPALTASKPRAASASASRHKARRACPHRALGQRAGGGTRAWRLRPAWTASPTSRWHRQRLFAEIARVLGLDASAPVQQPGSATASTGDAPIDWVHGCRQWFWKQRCAKPWAAGHPDLPAQLQALRASSGTSALEAQAHRLRGATANLALAPLQAQLGRVEAAARAADAAAIDRALGHPPALVQD